MFYSVADKTYHILFTGQNQETALELVDGGKGILGEGTTAWAAEVEARRLAEMANKAAQPVNPQTQRIDRMARHTPESLIEDNGLHERIIRMKESGMETKAISAELKMDTRRVAGYLRRRRPGVLGEGPTNHKPKPKPSPKVEEAAPSGLRLAASPSDTPPGTQILRLSVSSMTVSIHATGELTKKDLTMLKEVITILADTD